MADSEEKESKYKIIRNLVRFSKRVTIPGTNGLSLYHLLDIYGTGIIKGTFSSRASSIAYSFFVAIFPFLLFILNLIPIVPVEGFQTRFLRFIENLLPPQTTEFFYPVIADIAVNPRGGLLSFVFFLSIFLAANGVNAIFSAFEYSFHVTMNRTFFRQYLIALVVSIFLALLLLFTVGVILYGEYIIANLKGNDYISNELFWISALQLTVFVVMVYVIIATLYYYGTKEGKESRFFSLGAIITTLLFLLTTYLFGVYINNFSNYNELYGSLGALLIMMLYIWINANLLLLGFELNISLQRLKDKNEENTD
ncbi:MAG: YihY/virulence factor BrkB family protein [Flavobacteriales bacterium]|jgi:membrane protein|uniref:YihY/virulence factor BrkB family protein n=1 Tax=Candidatus Ulvibacter alkanivorans TaxID=2267620 RepID=UPI000DF20594|nr:YihY/virulence factor BrkB family protein [Candidatus Ulvibacter alkanivorans]MCH2488853.1 YihY/virulence factor BrkB family protein [Flavobacteriales bacterium]